jgi:hypothetical protein
MLSSINKLFARRPAPSVASLMPETATVANVSQSRSQYNQQTYSKVFRWKATEGQEQVETVEVVGSFTNWQKVSLLPDKTTNSWQATVHEIPGNKTHHYMILVNGEPANDRNCDGLALPIGPQEERYQINTHRGPRVFMLFAQAK